MKVLRKIREERGVTQSQLSYALKIPQGVLSKAEHGKLFPWLKARKKLEKFFGRPFERLWQEAEEPGGDCAAA